MRDPARLQAAIDILDNVIAAVAQEGAAADTLVQRYFASRRYAGSKDRAAVRELVYAAIRFSADPPASGRAALLGLAEQLRPELLPLFDGSAHAPAPSRDDEERALASAVPAWLEPALRARFGAGFDREIAALAARAPLDLRVNRLKADPAEVAAALNAIPIAGLPEGLRIDPPIPLDRHPLLMGGAVEVQDAASQHAVALAAARPGECVIDLCAGAGGKTLGLAAAMAMQGQLFATDTDRSRLTAMRPRLVRAGVDGFVEQRLLNPGQEEAALADLQGKADLVLIDAPCSGTGTWRRNPELRWRLTADRLARLLLVQARLIAIGASLIAPGGRLVYAVCSVLEAEGPEQVRAASGQLGLVVASQRALTPATDGCDGFFVAQLVRS